MREGRKGRKKRITKISQRYYSFFDLHEEHSLQWTTTKPVLWNVAAKTKKIGFGIYSFI